MGTLHRFQDDVVPHVAVVCDDMVKAVMLIHSSRNSETDKEPIRTAVWAFLDRGIEKGRMSFLFGEVVRSEHHLEIL